MLAVISPAKTLDFAPLSRDFTTSQPQLLSHSEELISICRTISPQDLAHLMKISDKLAALNVARYAEWQKAHNSTNSKAAIFAFKGDVYTGIDAESLTDTQIHYAQKHLMVLSGLYGTLKPLDLIQPYRLEMGTKLVTSRGKNLYAFWADIITHSIQQALNEQTDQILINLASDEYFGALTPKKLNARIIKPIFLDEKNGKFKVINFYAKKARGLMVRYLLQTQPTVPEELQDFNLAGYAFDEQASSQDEWVFKRREDERA